MANRTASRMAIRVARRTSKAARRVAMVNSRTLRSAQARQALKQALERRSKAVATAWRVRSTIPRSVRVACSKSSVGKELEMLSAYTRPANGAQPGSGGPNGNRPNGLSWERAEAMAEQKRGLQSELDSLQRDMQARASAEEIEKRGMSDGSGVRRCSLERAPWSGSTYR